MWIQDPDPLGVPWLSALVAAIPILLFLVCLVVLKLTGLQAAGVALVAEVAVALGMFGMPIPALAGAGLLGVLSAIWPIAYIILMAVWLYRLAVASGKFDVIRASIAAISPDQRIQVLLIAFCFGAFLEGVAGFGVPIAICAAMLVTLGFRPVRAAMISLVANFAAGAYGAVGIPVIVGAQVGGIDVMDLSRDLALILQPVTLLIPFLLVVILDGFRGLRETWPATLVVTLVFSGTQAAVLLFLGPELAAILPGLLGMVALAALRLVWTPRHVFVEGEARAVSGRPARGGAVRDAGRSGGSAATATLTAPVAVAPPAVPAPARHTAREVLAAWSPFYVLTVLVFVWSTPAFKALSAPGGPLAWAVVTVPMPGVTGRITTAGGAVVANAWSWTPIGATGTAILLAVVITALTSRALTRAVVLEQLRGTGRDLGKALVLIAAILVLAQIANLSGGSAGIGGALAGAGSWFPLLAPVIGWVGVFLTGSVVNANTLFAQLQATTAGRIGVDATLLVAASTAGGAAGKVISPQSIAIAAGAVGLTGRESEILRASIGYSLGILVVLSLWTFGLSQLLPG
ncbi:L-lactate permease [Clavibacter michiganensis]|uniref:L-lactate permease n=5 Tax=Clavibacter michiganensis TaxID=28447 RepID=A0A0D5CF16_9MICO|nr:L-lactate permease [Clavibacter michiganensis]AJW77847.1 L-lactate permease [Clavibacter michiganensis subsp. insidiosus]AWF96994.1 L-lactate permease [Clavibacter michiganensis subsp. insidiosus]AWG00062.1 L-lactate permease [Clavibacter michiganensis subsp. insidiosus]OQJ58575.1 L-lactate permease [Clavibacter michiganensis subsp. insidiosus]RMC85208.1 L-lactate permease [Clavibacter michiganensis subsp. insidiosus]